jgi:uncharacterized protein YndB with AHSA1/START domain
MKQQSSAPDAADIGHGLRARIVAAALNQHDQSGIERGNVPLFRRNIVNVPVNNATDQSSSTSPCERRTPMKINVETTVAAPIEQVWRAYTTPADIKQWNAASDDWHTTAASVDLREGGAFSSRMEAKDGSMGFDFAGTYTKIVKHKLIEYSFGDRMAQVEFTPDAKGVVVRVTFDSEPTHSIEQQQGGWQAILNNFARHVEGNQKKS